MSVLISGLILIYTVGDIGIIIAGLGSPTFIDEINHIACLRHHFCVALPEISGHLITVHGIIKAIGPAHAPSLRLVPKVISQVSLYSLLSRCSERMVEKPKASITGTSSTTYR